MNSFTHTQCSQETDDLSACMSEVPADSCLIGGGRQQP